MMKQQDKGQAMTEPRPGDRVRVTFEATVTAVNGNGRVVQVDSDELVSAIATPIDATFEVIEPGADPEHDPVGTVRRRTEYPASRPAIRHGQIGRPWKTLSGTYYEHDEVAGWEIIGAVPGTPAAERHEFKPSYSGMVCEQMVMRDGHGDACGLTPADPVHS